MVSLVFANGSYHTMYFQISHPNGGEFTFPDELSCLERVDNVSHQAQAREWTPGRKSQAFPLGALCLPGTLADFIRSRVSEKIPTQQIGQVQIPTDVLTDYVPPKPLEAAPAPAAPPAAAPAQPKAGQPKGRQ